MEKQSRFCTARIPAASLPSPLTLCCLRRRWIMTRAARNPNTNFFPMRKWRIISKTNRRKTHEQEKQNHGEASHDRKGEKGLPLLLRGGGCRSYARRHEHDRVRGGRPDYGGQ